MIQLFYGGLFLAALLFAAFYITIWHSHFDLNITLVFIFVPIACLGYFLFSLSTNLEEALVCQKMIYIGGCYLSLFIFLSILDICKVEISKWLRLILYIGCTVIYGSVLTIGYAPYYYKEVSFLIAGGLPLLKKAYGPMHLVYYISLIGFFLAGLVVIYRSWKKKHQIPRSILLLFVFPESLSVLTFLAGRLLHSPVDVYPVAYVLALIVYLIIVNRLSLYNVNETVIDSMVRGREIGYASFDFKYRFLGSNETARLLVPKLGELAVDDRLGDTPAEKRIAHYLDSFQKDNSNNTFAYTVAEDDENEERIYNVNVNYLYNGSKKFGYIITYTDDTANKKYIRLLDTYNEKLESEVEQKTEHIVKMHDNLILSLAMMVESRDNSTGGHITRTSEGVRILVDEMKKLGTFELSDEFCKDVIKAAPMHDLGKIAVDDAILRKPGKFTDEEYAKMKEHSTEGAKVIHKILQNTDDESFKKVAENVAHYHHERWDGKGYPCGLSGEQIPLEARIMAVADVYDALVSKRVYKEAFDFEKANAIILEGMGSQFDPALKDVYEMARPKLEAFYQNEAIHL